MAIFTVAAVLPRRQGDGRVVPQPALSSFPSSLAPGSPPEFFTAVRYSALVMTLPSCSAQNIALMESSLRVIAVEPDFLNHALRGCPAESGLICDDGKNPNDLR